MNKNKKRRLSLNKQTLRTLDNVSLQAVAGGVELASFLTIGKKCKKSAKVGGGGYTCNCDVIE